MDSEYPVNNNVTFKYKGSTVTEVIGEWEWMGKNSGNRNYRLRIESQEQILLQQHNKLNSPMTMDFMVVFEFGNKPSLVNSLHRKESSLGPVPNTLFRERLIGNRLDSSCSQNRSYGTTLTAYIYQHA